MMSYFLLNDSAAVQQINKITHWLSMLIAPSLLLWEKMWNAQSFNSTLSEAFEQFGSGFSPLKEPAHMGCSIHKPRSHFWFHRSCKPNPPRPAPSTARFQAARPNLRCLGLKLLEKVLSDTEALGLIVIWMLSHNDQQCPAHTALWSSHPAEVVRRDQSLQCPRAKYCG